MAMGLRFAGSANEEAFNTLLSYCQMFISLCTKSVAELCGKSTIETCINVTLISLSMVSYWLMIIFICFNFLSLHTACFLLINHLTHFY